MTLKKKQQKKNWNKINDIDINKYAPSQYNEFIEDFFNSNHTSYSIVTGRGTVKSTLGALLAVLVCMLFGSVLVGRKYYSTVKRSIFSTIIACINRLGLSDYFEIKYSPLEITFLPNDNKIFFTALDDKEKGKGWADIGVGFALFLIDEAQETDDEIVRSFRQTLRRGYKSDIWKYRTLYLANPIRNKRHYTNKFKNSKNHLHLHLSYLDLDEYVQNNWLGDGFLEEADELKETDIELYNFEYLGDINAITKGLVFHNVKEFDSKTFQYPVGSVVLYGLDFGVREDPTSFGKLVYNSRTRELWVVEEWYKPADFKETSDVIKSRWGNPLTFADTAPTGAIEQLRIYGLTRTMPVIKHEVDAGIDWLRKLKAIYIDKSTAPNHYREFTEYEKVEKKDGSIVYSDKNNHTIDEVRYGAHQYINGLRR